MGMLFISNFAKAKPMAVDFVQNTRAAGLDTTKFNEIYVYIFLTSAIPCLLSMNCELCGSPLRDTINRQHFCQLTQNKLPAWQLNTVRCMEYRYIKVIFRNIYIKRIMR